MKLFIIGIFSALALGTINDSKSIHQFTVQDINGENFDMASLKGKKGNDCKYSVQMRTNPAV